MSNHNQREAAILEAMRTASLDEAEALRDELISLRQSRIAAAAQERELNLGASLVDVALTPVMVHGTSTASSDWLDRVEVAPSFESVRPTIVASATRWFRALSSHVVADIDEFEEQAANMAKREASAFGQTAPQAQRFYLAQVNAMRAHAVEEGTAAPTPGQVEPDQSGEAASSLPTQITPTEAPEVFDNFIAPVPAVDAPSTRAQNVTSAKTGEQCTVCGRPATKYVGGQAGHSASGHHVCDAHANHFDKTAALQGKTLSATALSAVLAGAMPNVDDIIRWEGGEMDDDEEAAFFQGLIDSGMAWQLQGVYGRTAQYLIDAGICHAAGTTGRRKTAETENKCPVCGGPGFFGDICMDCVKSRQRAAQDGRCHCGRKAIPGPERGGKPRGMRKWIPCERCLGTIRQTGSKTAEQINYGGGAGSDDPGIDFETYDAGHKGVYNGLGTDGRCEVCGATVLFNGFGPGDHMDPNTERLWVHVKRATASRRKVAWTADGSDISPVAEEIMEASNIPGTENGFSTPEERDAFYQKFVDAFRGKSFVQEATDDDLDCLTDYNFHAAREAIETLRRNAGKAASRRTAGAIDGVDCPGSGMGVPVSGTEVSSVICPECGQSTYASADGDGYGTVYVHLLPGKTLNDRVSSRRTASLSDKMDFDHVVQVLPNGEVVDAQGVYAPELYDDQLFDPSWTLLDGYSGQSGYSGPMMHASEFIGGRMERDILENPGYYVCLVNYSLDDTDEEPTEWAVAYKPAPVTASRPEA